MTSNNRYGYYIGYTSCLVDRVISSIPQAQRLDASTEESKYIENNGFVRTMIDGCRHIVGCCISDIVDNGLERTPLFDKLIQLCRSIEEALEEAVTIEKLHPLTHRTLSTLLSDVIALHDGISQSMNNLKRERDNTK